MSSLSLFWQRQRSLPQILDTGPGQVLYRPYYLSKNAQTELLGRYMDSPILLSSSEGALSFALSSADLRSV